MAEISGARLGRPDDAVGHLKEALRAGAGIASVGRVFGSVGADDDLLSMLAETALDATGEPAVDELEILLDWTRRAGAKPLEFRCLRHLHSEDALDNVSMRQLAGMHLDRERLETASVSSTRR